MGLIGRYLSQLSVAQEDRVLTERMGYAPYHLRADGCRCLIGIAADAQRNVANGRIEFRDKSGWAFGVGSYFDDLSQRFGEPRINAAIRGRILANRVRRELAGVQAAAHPVEGV